MATPEAPFDFAAERAQMTREQLARRGIVNPEVLRVMGGVPRHEFISPADWDEAYADRPLGIACRQTISQPYIVAYMTEALELRPGLRVLEIGTGSGYQTAVLAALGAEVFTVERFAELSETAQARLERLKLTEKVHFRVGDGSVGWPEDAPFDRIIVTAAAPELPAPLRRQLAEGGVLVAPVGKRRQKLELGRVEKGLYQSRLDLEVIFVPLVGAAGLAEE